MELAYKCFLMSRAKCPELISSRRTTRFGSKARNNANPASKSITALLFRRKLIEPSIGTNLSPAVSSTLRRRCVRKP